MSLINFAIISGNNADQVETEVKRLLNNGWKLAGGISTAFIPGQDPRDKRDVIYTQALIKD